MTKYTIKRLLQSLITVLAIVTIVFLLMRMLPTDYYFTEDQVMKLTEEAKNDQLRAAGLLDPLPVQLFRFYGRLARLDFGTSRRLQSGVPVMQLISSKFTVSMRLGMMAMGVSLVLGILMGVCQTLNKDRFLDHTGTVYTVFVNAVPSLVSFSLVLAFGSRVLKLPSMYSTRNPGPSSILPVVCLSLASIASYALWTRRYMVDELNKDYIKLARAKGVPGGQISRKHVFRNAMVPLIQYIPNSILFTLMGSLYVESLYSIPGMGGLLVTVIKRQDNNMVLALVVIYAVISILGLLFGDLLMALLDPRITLAGKEESR